MKTNFFRSIVFACLFVGSTFFIACKNDKKEEKISNEFGLSTTQYDKVFEAYLKLSDALVKEEVKNAQKHAEQMATAYEHDENEIVLLAVSISEIEDLEEQRTLFYQLSERMEHFLDTYISSGEVYKQYCPMAFDDTGAFWFSTSKEIINPYFGDKMLHCGEIQKTIKK